MDHDTTTLVCLGDAVKSLDDAGKIGGYLVHFGDETTPDLQGDYFTKATDFGLSYITAAPIYFAHCKDATIGGKDFGKVSLKADDVGIWAEGVIDKADKYAKAILAMVKAGKLRWSSGTAPNVMLRTSVKGVERIDRWPIVDATLTPMPVEFRGTGVMSVKSLLDLSALKGEHLGDDVERRMTSSALSSLHYAMQDRVHGHIADPKKTKAQKLAACKGCLDEHHEAAMKCLKAMMPDDGDDAGPPASTKARADWLAANAPR
jgi:hypothetical protein